MNLSEKEKRWLPFWGTTGKSPCARLAGLTATAPDAEQTFESICHQPCPNTPVMVNNHWDFLENAALYLATKPDEEKMMSLKHLLQRNGDFSELFILHNDGTVGFSSYSRHISSKTAMQRLEKRLERPVPAWPLRDIATEQIGPSSSAVPRSGDPDVLPATDARRPRLPAVSAAGCPTMSWAI